ncbi:MAG TPA: glycogen synthase GlgA [Rhizomicrobium sp.]|nr:glycogen synthase GlgA [Rhizomicrobium sp.]
MRILFVTSEAYPLAKTGGLADVSRSLPAALMRLGADVRVLMPGYPRALELIAHPKVVAQMRPMLGVADGQLIAGRFPDCDLPVWLVDSPSLFDRPGGLYQDGDGRDWPDNATRFAYFSKVAAELALGRTPVGWHPDVVHANDWHTGLLPLLLAEARTERPRTVFTTHNMAFQGNFAPEELHDLPERIRGSKAIEFYGRQSFLKAGLRYADRVTTVSPTYAKEILSHEFGFGFEDVLRERGRDFCGILNGIDDAIWNPATDPLLPRNYFVSDISGKRVCKRSLQQELGLEFAPDHVPLFGFVSRLTHQKMADVLLEVLPWIVEQDAQLAVVGEGDRAIEAALLEARRRYEGRVSVTIGYNEPLAHRLQAGSDMLLAPARFEPCGLTQLYAMRYGTLPIVRRTGGLADTVVDATARTIAGRTATGFVFERDDAAGMMAAMMRALALFREPLHWRLMQLQAMTREFSWETSAAKYLELYRDATNGVQHVDVAVEGDGTEELRAAG